MTTFVLSFIKMVLYFILIITVIGILGLETSSFLALFASAGVAIGMALSGTLQNFAGGVLILLLKPYKVGDYIEAQGYAGTVKATTDLSYRDKYSGQQGHNNTQRRSFHRFHKQLFT